MIEKSLLSVLLGAVPCANSSLCVCDAGQESESSPRSSRGRVLPVQDGLQRVLGIGQHGASPAVAALRVCCCTCALRWAVAVNRV